MIFEYLVLLDLKRFYNAMNLRLKSFVILLNCCSIITADSSLVINTFVKEEPYNRDLLGLQG